MWSRGDVVVLRSQLVIMVSAQGWEILLLHSRYKGDYLILGLWALCSSKVVLCKNAQQFLQSERGTCLFFSGLSLSCSLIHPLLRVPRLTLYIWHDRVYKQNTRSLSCGGGSPWCHVLHHLSRWKHHSPCRSRFGFNVHFMKQQVYDV